MREAITVTQLNRYIKDMFAQNRLLYDVIVKGEISNFKESHGNFYFSLKDESSVIQAIIFNNFYNVKKTEDDFFNEIDNLSNLKDGMEVTVTGRIAVYEKNGTYAIYVNKIENTGLGEYFVKLEELKKKLSEMGMFDAEYKKEIPKYSLNIGVVTAKNGAAIKDIIRTLKNKNPFVRIVLYPALVQGEGAFKSIIDGIMTLDKMNLDNIIIGRGGGSIEDLYCFNDERVAYAIFNAKTPIISAVGHEINYTIADYVADIRVATPTAAAEMATFSYEDFINDIDAYKNLIKEKLNDKFLYIKSELELKKQQIELLSPKSRLNSYKEKINLSKEKMKNFLNLKLIDCKNKIEKYILMMKSRDVLDKISKGLLYATYKKNKKLVSINNVDIGDKISLLLIDGTLESKIIQKKGTNY